MYVTIDGTSLMMPQRAARIMGDGSEPSLIFKQQVVIFYITESVHETAQIIHQKVFYTSNDTYFIEVVVC